MNAVEIVIGGSILLVALLAFSLLKKEKTEGERFFLFWSLAIVIIFVTSFLILTTVQENLTSVTGGPVHWHADFEIYVCGEEVDLKDPTGLANRIGSPVLHEHGDNRIHVEGTVSKLQDASLSGYFEIIGGQLTKGYIIVPTNQGLVEARNGSSCPDGAAGNLQVFLYKTEGKTVIQEKLTDFPNYVLSAHSIVPPGDCIIIEFTPEIKNRTDNICTFYQIAIEKGELLYGD